MKMLLAAVMLFGSTIGAMAVEAYGIIVTTLMQNPSSSSAPRRASKKSYPVDMRRHGHGNRVEMYRYDDGGIGKTPDVRPRSWDGGYVPVQPRSASPDGFWSPIDQSSEGRELRQQRFR